MSRFLSLLAFTLLTLLGVGVTNASDDIPHLVASIEDARWASASQPAQQQWRAGEDSPDVDRDAMEVENDDDDDDDSDDDDFGDEDPRSHALADSVVQVRGAGVTSCPGGALRCEPQADTSRFACGLGLPRGPPV